ncbi:hypothetical protein B0H34DRAFT_862560 [Crassisporium funariophilum]|nr:hypothetical protein B0H34DRAFT_862560 [Crassisporium funariophilum]
MASPPDPPSPSPAERQFSPVKKYNLLHQSSGNRRVVHASLPKEDTEEMVKLSVAEFCDALDYNLDDFKQSSPLDKYDAKEDFIKYMNDISAQICVELNADQIYFHDVRNRKLLQHSTETNCRPDSVAVRSRDNNEIHWSDVEAAIKIHSKGTNLTDGPLQAMSYAYYLLQARPDRVAVQGMYVDEGGVTLFLVSCTEIKRTQRLSLTTLANVRLLYAFVKQLYDPLPLMVDPTIRMRKKDGEKPRLFNIELKIPGLPPTICEGYRIFDCAPTRGQRTHIFVNLENPTIVEDQHVLVIKDQYRLGDHRFSEKDVINHIHSDGEVPGIVCIVYAKQVYRANGSVVSFGCREKTRICMVNYGSHMMGVKTPKAALMMIYDLLKATCFIYFNKNVLHRDISEGNVLVIENAKEVEITEGVKAQLCFIEHILNRKADPCKTSLLLVDFDRGDIRAANKKPHTERTGTTIFMAKAIWQGKPHGHPGGPAVYKSVPQITAQVRAAYKAAHPDRSISFPDSTGYELSRIGTADENDFRHELYHDAESAYWLLLRWVLLAYPAGTLPTEIPPTLWVLLTGTDNDYRPYRIAPHSLNPGYRELAQLLADIGGVFESNMHWAKQEPYKHLNFAHKAFQRYILNFIIKNKDEEFMDHPKADSPQPCTPSLYPYSEVARTLPVIEGTFTSSRSSSQSSSPSPFLDDDSMPPPSSSHPRTTRLRKGDLSGLPMSLVP